MRAVLRSSAFKCSLVSVRVRVGSDGAACAARTLLRLQERASFASAV